MNKNARLKNKLAALNTYPDKQQLTPATISENVPFTAETPQGKGVLATVPSLNNASVIESFQSNVMGKDADLGTMVQMLETSIQQVSNADLSGLEAMLVGQATALQTIFTSLARRAAVQQGLAQYQTYMGLALKAQAQSRATITALADLKRPKQSAFIGQANLTTGPQQVNNVVHCIAPVASSQIPPNQLSGVLNELHQNP